MFQKKKLTANIDVLLKSQEVLRQGYLDDFGVMPMF